MNELISVVIPAYNAAKYLDEAILSVVNQSYVNWELIVVNDGSKDDTLVIAEKYLSDSRVSVYTQQNAGVSVARNNGNNMSRGKYVSFLDADDIWNKDFLKKTIAAYTTNPDVGLVHTDMISINEHSEITGKEFRGKNGWVLDDLLYWDDTVVSTPSGVVFARSCLDKIGNWNTNLSTAADQDMYFRVAAQYKVIRVPELLVFYRIHGQNMHTKNAKLFERDHLRTYRLAKERKLFKSKMFEQKCFAKLYYILSGENWVNEKIARSLYYIMIAFFAYPPVIISIFYKKFFNKKFLKSAISKMHLMTPDSK